MNRVSAGSAILIVGDVIFIVVVPLVGNRLPVVALFPNNVTSHPMESVNCRNGQTLPLRVVFVELEETVSGAGAGVSNQNFQVDLSSFESASGNEDFSFIVNDMLETAPELSEILKNQQLEWKVASKHFQNRYFDVGKKAIPPLDHQSVVKCLYTKTSASSLNLRAQDHDAVSSPNVKTGHCSTLIHLADNYLDIPSVPPQAEPNEEFNQGNEKSMSDNEMVIEGDTHSESEESNAGPSASVRLSESRNITKRLDFNKYVLPDYFNPAINKKLSKGEALSNNEQSLVCRFVAQSVLPFTLRPDKSTYLKLAQRLVDKYEKSLAGANQTDRSTAVEFYVSKLQLIFGRERAKAGCQLSKKGGRPRKEKIVQDSEQPACGTDEIQPPDMISYVANVKKMYEEFKKSPRAPGLRQLWKATHPGRKYEIAKFMLTVDTVLKTKCPLLDQPAYLCDEFDLLMGKNMCKLFREKWATAVPLILKVAERENSKNVKSLFKKLEKNLDDFDSQSCAALELLPVLLAGSMKNSMNSRRFFFDVHEDTANLASIIETHPVRSSPYIVKIGEAYNIVADGQSFLYASSSATEAFLCLMATYYVLGIVLCKQVTPTLYFAMSELMDKPDTSTRSCKVLRTFLLQLRDARDEI